MARLRSTLLLALVVAVFAAWANAGDGSRLLGSWALYSDVESNTANTITAATLAAPTLVSASATTPVAPGTITLTWTTAGDAADKIRIHRKDVACASAGSFAVVATVAETPATYADSGLNEGTYCYKIQGVIQNWTSDFSTTKQASIESPISADDLFLKSPGTSTTACETLSNTLVTSGASGGCKLESVTHPPFITASWCTTGTVKANQGGWTLTLALDISNPFESATLSADLLLGGTVIASSGTFVIDQAGPSTVTVNLTSVGGSPPETGILCLRITNQTVDSNPNSGAAHDAKIVTTGTSKIRGPWDPYP